MFAAIMSTTGCKTAALIIEIAEGKGLHIVNIDASTIYLWIRFKNENAVPADITDWSFKIWENNELVLEINKSNYKDLLGEFVYHFADQAITNKGNFILDNCKTPDTCDAYWGDLYKGKNPDRVTATITINDLNRHTIEVTGSFDFQFKRE